MVYRLLGGAEAARTFLNEPHEELGGRPLDIAGSGPEGLQRVMEQLSLAVAHAG